MTGTSDKALADIADRFAHYFAAQTPGASDVAVTEISRIHGGASRETFRLRLEYNDDGVAHIRRLILRRDPTSSLIETERVVEFEVYRAFAKTPVPVPGALFFERHDDWLDRPFFVMEEITDSTPGNIIQANPYGENRQRVGEQFWRILGAIHRENPAVLGLTATLDAVEATTCWQRELDHWEGVIDEDEMEPQPAVRGAIRWLRANPPPPAQRVTVVHGDYRNGNFLVGGKGEITAILDWEMCHLGDPLEDVAWAIDPLWSRPGENPGGMLPAGEAIALWEAGSGMKADAAALRWWRIFSAIKGMAIWISAAKEFASGANMDPVLGFSGWYPAQRHNEILAGLMLDIWQEQTNHAA